MKRIKKKEAIYSWHQIWEENLISWKKCKNNGGQSKLKLKFLAR